MALDDMEFLGLIKWKTGGLNFPRFRAIDFAGHYIFELAVIALIYFFLVRLGLTLASVNPSASPVWPATGFALAILLLRGSRFWPAIMLGACLGNLSSAGSIYTASAIAAGNSIEAIVAASLINRWSGGVHTFTTPGRIVKFALISTAATAISPAIGVTSLSLAGHAEWSAFSSIFVTWWLGDLAGALMVAPAIVLWATAPTRQQATKTIAVLLVSAGIGLIAFSPIIEQTVDRTPLGFLAVVPLVWTALNRNPRDTATAAFILSAFAVWGTSAGGGPFSWAGFNNSFMLLIMFIVSVAIPSLMLSAMAAELDEAHKTLEQKVDERTRQLELANQAKSRLITIASHDLRQPLHALGLLAAQFGDSVDPIEKGRIAGQIDTAVDSMNTLFDQLLDIAKLNSGVLSPDVSEFPIASVFKIVESTFEAIARNKGLSFRIVPSRAWVRSDPVLLQRIVLNLVSNAVRYTNEGGVLIGCRRRGECLRVEVWDSGLGIPNAEHQRIFAEFYRLPHSAHHSQSGLGLGLAIVERLCVLLQHSIELNSVLGKGSVFRIIVPRIAPQVEIADAARAVRDEIEKFDEKLAVLIDDDRLVLNSMAALLEKWGCLVVASSSGEAVLNMLAKYDRPPDLIISDYHLSQGRTGIQAITRLREALGVAIPAFLMTGDTDLERLSDVRSIGYHLLKKPVSPRAMRAMLTHFFKKQAAAHPSPTGVQRQP